MRLEDIGFYTLSDARAAGASASSPLWRCEMILTDLCNLRCRYCYNGRHFQRVMPVEVMAAAIAVACSGSGGGEDAYRPPGIAPDHAPDLAPDAADVLPDAETGVEVPVVLTDGQAPDYSIAPNGPGNSLIVDWCRYL